MRDGFMVQLYHDLRDLLNSLAISMSRGFAVVVLMRYNILGVMRRVAGFEVVMGEDERNYCVYILSCADGTLYTGMACALERRLSAHSAGKGARYTRGRLPVELVFSLGDISKVQAARVEYRVKSLTRTQKEALIAGDPQLLALVKERAAENPPLQLAK